MTESNRTESIWTTDRSAMFNVLVIVALSAAIATNCGSSAKVDHRVVARDVTFYTGSIAILIASTEDGIVEWWEVRRNRCLSWLIKISQVSA